MLETRSEQRHLANLHEQVTIVNRREDVVPDRPRGLRRFRKENQNYQAPVDKFFEDEMEIARLTIENAILTGRYVPQNATKKPETFVNLEGSDNESLDTNPFEELESIPVSQLTSEERELFFQSIDNIRQYLIRYLDDQCGVKPQNGEDIVQDAILKIVRFSNTGKLGREYFDSGRLKALMLRTVKFTRVDWLREERGQKVQTPYPCLISIDKINAGSNDYRKLSYEDEGFEKAEDEREKYLRREEYLREIKLALPDLSEYQRRVLVLRVFFGLKFLQIGQILEKDPGAIRVVFSQTKKKLRKILTAA